MKFTLSAQFYEKGFSFRRTTVQNTLDDTLIQGSKTKIYFIYLKIISKSLKFVTAQVV